MNAALALAGVSVDISGRRVVDDVTLDIAPGEVLGVLGPNGGGKTTLLRAALGLAALSAGEARLAGRPAHKLSEIERASLAGYLPQDRRIGWNLPAWRVAALGTPGEPPERARTHALAALAEVGVDALADRGVLDMSGGERARVLLGRLLATSAPLLVADEPAAGLDPDAQFQVMEILRRRADLGAAVVVTLHDLTLAARGCDRLAVLAGGRLLAIGAPEAVLTPDLLRSAFALEGRLEASAFGWVVVARRRI